MKPQSSKNLSSSVAFFETSVFAPAAFSAGAPTAVVAVARRLGFAAQCFELVPGLEVLIVKDLCEAFAFIALQQHDDFIIHRQDVHDLAFASRRDHPFIPLWQILTSLYILLIFIDETAAQTTT